MADLALKLSTQGFQTLPITLGYLVVLGDGLLCAPRRRAVTSSTAVLTWRSASAAASSILWRRLGSCRDSTRSRTSCPSLPGWRAARASISTTPSPKRCSQPPLRLSASLMRFLGSSQSTTCCSVRATGSSFTRAEAIVHLRAGRLYRRGLGYLFSRWGIFLFREGEDRYGPVRSLRK